MGALAKKKKKKLFFLPRLSSVAVFRLGELLKMFDLRLGSGPAWRLMSALD